MIKILLIKKILISKSLTEIITTENYVINGRNIVLDANKNVIKSGEKTTITDQDNNKIYLENFEYLKNENIFKSIGFIKIIDSTENSFIR